MLTRRRRLLLIGLTLLTAVVLLAGSAAQPVTVRSDGGGVQPQTYCQWYWNGAIQLWCYRCCDVYGCYDMFCDFDPW